jgi:hypothetical protein
MFLLGLPLRTHPWLKNSFLLDSQRMSDVSDRETFLSPTNSDSLRQKRDFSTPTPDFAN